MNRMLIMLEFRYVNFRCRVTIARHLFYYPKSQYPSYSNEPHQPPLRTKWRCRSTRDWIISLRISAKKCLFDGDAEGAAIYMDVAAEVAQDGHSYVITFLAEYAAIDGMRTIDDEL